MSSITESILASLPHRLTESHIRQDPELRGIAETAVRHFDGRSAHILDLQRTLTDGGRLSSRQAAAALNELSNLARQSQMKALHSAKEPVR